jgi:hypothetical protein
MQSFPHQILDDGMMVYFGQSLQEVEKAFGTSAFDIPLRIARKGIDKKLVANGVSLEFDTERLRSMEFTKGYQFKTPLKPYAQPWKNFEIINGRCIKARMSRDEFAAYIATWEARARELGAEKMDSADLKQNQYRVSFDKDKFADMFHACMGPTRRAGGGGIWADGWTAFFAIPRNSKSIELSVGELQSLNAFCDEFNTVARRKD